MYHLMQYHSIHGYEGYNDTIKLDMFHSVFPSPQDQMELPCSTYALTLCELPCPLREERDEESDKGRNIFIFNCTLLYPTLPISFIFHFKLTYEFWKAT